MTDLQVDAHRVDAVLIGGGIASATVAALLSELEPDWRIQVIERLDAIGQESSSGWNNAGTGHSALCELNYTPQDIDGSVNPAKALQINQQFQHSREYWAHLVDSGRISSPSSFVNPVPHMSFVQGSDNVDYLHRRHRALSSNALFRGMEFTTDHARLAEWAPLISEGRPVTQTIAATRSPDGTDVNFGELTRVLLRFAETVGTTVTTGRTVTDLRRMGRDWGVMSEGAGGDVAVHRAPLVFVGAGGYALPLLQKAQIPEIEGYAGFPISGQWLRCTNPEVIERHCAKVYGRAAVGAPPMSVPHLDTRHIDGERGLLFGPYAGWTPKFLKTGKLWDLPASITPDNILGMIAVAPPNLDLVGYLVAEVAATRGKRMRALREYMPSAQEEDWELITAGQRVQVIAPDAKKKGVLKFGTELIATADGSLGGMLGASPGASISTTIMLSLLGRMLPERAETWAPKVREMVPSIGTDLGADAEAAARSLDRTTRILGLDH